MIISDTNLSDDKNITDTKENQDKKLCYIYKHILLDKNEVFYIGKGTNTNGKYARSKEKTGRNPYWERVVRKYKHRVEIIIDGLSEQEANEREKQLILDYGRIDLGKGTLVNMTDGGEGCLGHVVSDETRKKQSDVMKGNKNCLGYKHTEEARKNMSGKIHSDEHRRKNSEANKGKKRSEETIEKIRQASLKQRHTEETKEKIRKQKSCKPVGQYKDEILINEYPSLCGSKINGFDPSLISKCCRGKIPHHKGFQWKYL